MIPNDPGQWPKKTHIMKHLTLSLLLLTGLVSRGQYANLKDRNQKQDTALEMIFQQYLKANDSAADLRTIEKINQFSDSADKYMALALLYLKKQQLDSCIRIIHIANMYINNTQVLLHIKKTDEWLQYPMY